MKCFVAIAVLAVFAAALYVLHHELAQVHLREVMASFRAIPVSAFALAVALTVLSYAVLAGYDCIGLRYAGLQGGVWPNCGGPVRRRRRLAECTA